MATSFKLNQLSSNASNSPSSTAASGGNMNKPANYAGMAGGNAELNETQTKVANLAKISAKTFFDFVLQSSQNNNNNRTTEINFSEILEHADKFNRVFVDTLTQKWNDIQSAKSNSVDYSQHCDSADEDEVFENALYQPCPENPQLEEPVYENSDDTEDYEMKRCGDDTSSMGDVTPTPPCESHYSSMCDTTSGGSGTPENRVYDTPAAALIATSNSSGNSGEHQTTNTCNNLQSANSAVCATTAISYQPQPPLHQLQFEDLEKKMKAAMNLNLKENNNNNNAAQSKSGRPKLKEAIMEFGSEASEFLRSSRKDSPKHSAAIRLSGPVGGQSSGDKVGAVTKKESVLEVRVPKTDVQPASWQACRLVLLQTQGGLMLNVFTPPESDRLFVNICCPLIYELGEATESQFGKTADRVLVIKARENISVTLRARNYEDKHDWICVLRENTDAKNTKRVIYTDAEQSSLSPMTPTQEMFDTRQGGGAQLSMKGGNNSNGHYMDPSIVTDQRRTSVSSVGSSGSVYNRDSMDRNQYVSAQLPKGDSFDRQASAPNPPTYIYQDGAVYARQSSIPGAGSNSKSSSQVDINRNDANSGNHIQRVTSCGDFMNSAPGRGVTPGGGGGAVYGRVPPLDQLRTYPWFHGKLPRETASKMVLAQSNPAAGHGIYLVRQSESNENEFTLTFNYEGKAKHLRINVDNQTGICQLQNLQFKSLRHLIDTYTKEKLPIDVKGSSDIILKSYIANFTGAQNKDAFQHKRNKSVDFNMERKHDVGPPSNGGGAVGLGRHTSLIAQYASAQNSPQGGAVRPQRVNTNQGVYYASHN